MKEIPFNSEITNEEYERLYADRLTKLFDFYTDNNIDARLIGSLGAAASLGQPVASFQAEYGGLRDIDVMVISDTEKQGSLPDPEYLERLVYPIPFDQHYRHQVISQPDGSLIRYKGITREVDWKVFQKKDGLIAGTTVPTLDPNTLFHLTALHGPLRPKDMRNVRSLLQDIRVHDDVLGEELFKPFHSLNSERQHVYKGERILGEMRWVYHTSVPMQMRRAISKVSEPLWHSAIRTRQQ